MFSKVFNYSIAKSDKGSTYGDLFAAYTKMVSNGKRIVVKGERIVNDFYVRIYKKHVVGKKITLVGEVRFHWRSNAVGFTLCKCCGMVGPDEEFYEDALALVRACKDKVDLVAEAEKLANKVQSQKKFNSAIQQAKRCM